MSPVLIDEQSQVHRKRLTNIDAITNQKPRYYESAPYPRLEMFPNLKSF